MDGPLTEAQRFPLLTDAGRSRLYGMYEHPNAPRFNHRCGDRLDVAALQRVRAYAEELRTTPRGWEPGGLPPWLISFAAFCLADVPFYRRRGGIPEAFGDLPTTTRADLGREPWAFVPDSQPLDDLILYATSGTTGHPIDILCHPETSVKYLPLMETALATRGVTLEGGDRTAIAQVCAQWQTFTFAIVSSYLNGAGCVKINLAPAEWRDPDDRGKFLDSLDPELYTGDPIAFAELARLPLQSRPKALLSTAMTLTPALQAQLEARFGCPIIDLYSLNESGPVAVETGRGFEVLPHDLFVEILDAEGRPCKPGERGEVTLTGGRNPFLPLLRYRTGDWASLAFAGTTPILVDLEGRPPTIFRNPSGETVNNIDITWALRPFALSQFALHQAEDGSLCLRVRGFAIAEEPLRAALLDLFGTEQNLVIEEISDPEAWSGKIVQYTSADTR